MPCFPLCFMTCIIYLSWSKIEKKLQNKKKVGNSGHYRRVVLEKEASH